MWEIERRRRRFHSSAVRWHSTHSLSGLVKWLQRQWTGSWIGLAFKCRRRFERICSAISEEADTANKRARS